MVTQREAPRRVTQRMVAEKAGVSQSVVSLVLNGRTGTTARISDETRDRVLKVIRETSYAANPVARSLHGAATNLIGVFTYEPTFPAAPDDFYAPLLTGIERATEMSGADLLVFTSTPVVDGRRHLFDESNRLRIADGCVLLGREMDAGDLERLIAQDYPFVAVGRRDVLDGDLPYVGIDYATGCRRLVEEASKLGHTRFGLLHRSLSAESSVDRRRGILEGISAGRTFAEADAESDLSAGWQQIRDTDPTVVFVEDISQARLLEGLCRADGLRVPDDLSIIELGGDARPHPLDREYTRLVTPAIRLGTRAAELLSERIKGLRETADIHELLPCDIRTGDSLAPPGR